MPLGHHLQLDSVCFLEGDTTVGDTVVGDTAAAEDTAAAAEDTAAAEGMVVAEGTVVAEGIAVDNLLPFGWDYSSQNCLKAKDLYLAFVGVPNFAGRH